MSGPSRIRRFCGVGVIVTVAALLPGATSARASASSTGIPAASPSALAAANKLISDPWGALLPTIEADAQAGLASLDGKLIGPAGSTSTHGFKYSVGFVLDSLKPLLSISSPPGFRAAGPSGFSIRAPLNGAWSLGVSGTLAGHVKATAAGKTLVSGNTPPLPFSLTLSNVSIGATANLNSSDPTRPTLSSASIDVHAKLAGSLLFPSMPPGATTSVVRGAALVAFPPQRDSARVDGVLQQGDPPTIAHAPDETKRRTETGFSQNRET